MSYSFMVRGATVAAALAAVPAKFDEVVTGQPVHSKDREAATATASAMAGLIGEPREGEEVSLSVSGYLQWIVHHNVDEAPTDFTGASVSVQATIVAKTE